MSSIHEYVVGQRWLSHAEPELGLGIIKAIEGRILYLAFPAVEEERTYAITQAPLCRVSYRKDDRVQTKSDLHLTIKEVQSLKGFYIYLGVDREGNEHQILESDLAHTIEFNAPLQRLLSGQVDKQKHFQLKIDTLRYLSKLQQSSAQGLIGSRTQLLPHQVYIAHQIAERFAPRVLLADEVGLGKTIEAGMILHHQLINGYANRVLILVPDSLINQWFVEMLRKFNLTFAIFDEERYQSILEDNPFETEQLVLASLDFLLANEAAHEHVLMSQWDMVIVDEAHHLEWHETHASENYQVVEALAKQCQGLLLLTATPEQMGIDSHFARLRLLDPARFHDLEAFKQEQQAFQQVKDVALSLIECQEQQGEVDLMPQALRESLQQSFHHPLPESISEALQVILDQHGTGRVLFRNTRTAIQGFPKRQLNFEILEKPDCYQELFELPLEEALHPETYVPQETWLNDDPRVAWLIAKLKQLRPNKVLIIAANASTAIALEMHLRLKTGLRATAFHEDLSILERDRASAYFSDPEDGADCLICSEIGSEGRNFQFAHHLVLFDLPFNPDLLEQRIGRLDRIGQQHDISIHVPVIKNTPMEILFRWYHQGLNIFEKSCSFGSQILLEFEETLLDLFSEERVAKRKVDLLLEDTKEEADKLHALYEEGRDKLLELSSFNKNVAANIIEQIQQQENPELLQAYMESVFDIYGIQFEQLSDTTFAIHPSEHMKSSYFPYLKDEGNTITFDRDTALSREDIDFISTEHPMLTEIMDVILNDGEGSAMLCTMSLPSLPKGTLLLEAFFTLRAVAPKHLGLHQYLPLKPIRVLTSIGGNDLSSIISFKQLSELCSRINRQQTPAVITQIRSQIETMSDLAHQLASKSVAQLKEQAHQKMAHDLDAELLRLKTLQAVNPNIRNEEIEFIQNKLAASTKAIADASLSLESVRVIINN